MMGSVMTYSERQVPGREQQNLFLLLSDFWIFIKWISFDISDIQPSEELSVIPIILDFSVIELCYLLLTHVQQAEYDAGKR